MSTKEIKVRYVGSSLDKKKDPAKFCQGLGRNLCGIRNCTRLTKRIGHMWKEGNEEYCYTMPLCDVHTAHKLADSFGSLLNAMKTNPPKQFKRREECWCTKDLIPGEVYEGGYRVKNVQCSTIDTGDKSKWWSKRTERDFSKQKCGIVECDEKAEHGGHVWVERNLSFCFILPLCARHNNYRNALSHEYHWSKPNALLVVREQQDKCGCSPTEGGGEPTRQPTEDGGEPTRPSTEGGGEGWFDWLERWCVIL